MNGAVLIGRSKPTGKARLLMDFSEDTYFVLLPGQLVFESLEIAIVEKVGVVKKLLGAVGINNDLVHERLASCSVGLSLGMDVSVRGFGASSMSI